MTNAQSTIKSSSIINEVCPPSLLHSMLLLLSCTPSVGEIVLAFFSTLPTILTPVDPNPPSPRSVSVNSSTCTAGHMEICSKINCAMRSPISIWKSSVPKLKRTTPTLPRSTSRIDYIIILMHICFWWKDGRE